ncbi:MAG: hypothetical protein QM757_16645 [Paludibaculum sp.]
MARTLFVSILSIVLAIGGQAGKPLPNWTTSKTESKTLGKTLLTISAVDVNKSGDYLSYSCDPTGRLVPKVGSRSDIAIEDLNPSDSSLTSVSYRFDVDSVAKTADALVINGDLVAAAFIHPSFLFRLHYATKLFLRYRVAGQTREREFQVSGFRAAADDLKAAGCDVEKLLPIVSPPPTFKKAR